MIVYLRYSETFSKKKGTKIRYPTYQKRIGRTAGLIYGRPYISRVHIIYRVRRGTHIGGDSVDGQWPQRRDGSSEF